MGVEVVDVRKELPKPSRKRGSIITSTPEWQETITKIDAGLKPHEGLKVVAQPEDLSQAWKIRAICLKNS